MLSLDFSRRVALNFDCLRAIAFELNLGQTFSEAISDLNIINIEREAYKVIAHFADGSAMSIPLPEFRNPPGFLFVWELLFAGGMR